MPTETLSQDKEGYTMNDFNLTPFTTETAIENGRKGGIASGEAKRERKLIREIITDFMEQEATATDKMLADYKIDTYTNGAIVAGKLIDKAKRGDVRATKLLMEIMGELERGKVTVNNIVEKDEDTELYKKGYWAGQRDVFAHLTDQELHNVIERTKYNIEVAEDERPLVLPNGPIIYGESMLED